MNKAPLHSRSPRRTPAALTLRPIGARRAPCVAARRAARHLGRHPRRRRCGTRQPSHPPCRHRHAAPLWALAGALLAAALLLGGQRWHPGTAPITQDDIDTAVRESLEKEPLPSAGGQGLRGHPAVGRACRRPDERRRTRRRRQAAEQRAMERSLGTGVVIIDNGTILTNLHVVVWAPRRSACALPTGTKATPRWSARSPRTTWPC